MAVIAKGKIRHNGNDFEPGDEVTGLTRSDAERLLKLGVAEGNINEHQEITDDLSVSEFADLKADEQKAILVGIGHEPGSNKEERIAQYAEWYESGDELDILKSLDDPDDPDDDDSDSDRNES